MYRFLLLFFILLLGMGFQYRSPSPQTNGFLLQLHADTPIGTLLQQSRTALRSSSPFLAKTLSEEHHLFFIQQDNGQVDSVLLHYFQRHPAVVHAQLSKRVAPRTPTPDDLFYETQWNLERIGAPEAWEYNSNGRTYDGHKLVLGILEPIGFDTEHEDLRNQVWHNPYETPDDSLDNDHNGYTDDWAGWNTAKQNDEHYPNRHGTAVAGVAGATGNNGLGITGLSWDTQLMLLSGTRYENEIVEAYLYVLDQRKRFRESGGKEGTLVVATNASFGIASQTPEDSPLWCEMFDLLGNEGILSVVATQNAGVNIDLRGDMPSSCPSDYLLSVTESNYLDELPDDVAWGPTTIDLAAPGRGTTILQPGNQYITAPNRGATSYATPHVTGAIGLLYGLPCQELAQATLYAPAVTARRIRRYIMEGVEQFPAMENRLVSGGRLHVGRSADLLMADCKINEDNAKIELQFYPNPVSARLQVKAMLPYAGPYQWRLHSAVGQLLKQGPINREQSGERSFEVDMTGLPAGVYVLKVDGQGLFAVKKVIKR